MIQQYVGGNLVPFLYTPLPSEEALKQVPQLNTYYVIKAISTSAIPEAFTGKVMGDIIFINGEAKVKTLYEKRLLLMRGCIDITPEWMLNLLKARKLEKILVIRNAAFGDTTILSPAFKALRERYPDSTIHFYGREDSRDVVFFNQYIDAIIDVRTTEIGQIKDYYDEVFDLVHSIECNPSADFRAALDVAHDLLFLDKPVQPQNIYQVTRQELMDAQEYLNQIGIIPELKKLIVFQYEGTALARSLSPITVFHVANYLADKGYDVLLWSHRPDILGYGFYLCTETEKLCAMPEVPEEKDKPLVLKNKEGKETIHQRVQWHPRVHMVLKNKEGQMMTFKNRRSKFAICSFARHIISVDSFISHLADSLGISSTIIFTNYHPYTRTKYYEKASVVHVDYEKELPCGPCNGLLNDCPFAKGTIPPCSSKIKHTDIINDVMKRLSGINDLYQPYRDEGALPDDYEKTPCSCKACKSKNTALVTVKGKVAFHRCLDCYSIFTNQAPSTEDTKFIHESYYDHKKIATIEKFLGFFGVKDLKKVDNVVKYENPESNLTQTYKFEDTRKLSRLSLFLETISSFETPEEFIDFLDTRTDVGHNIVFSILPADAWNHSNTWEPMLTSIAGMNRLIYSSNMIVKLFNKDTGIYKDRYKIIKAMDLENHRTAYLIERVK